MLLSVVIVSYNTCFFLEQCLYSVRKAMASLEGEIIVVDNASADDTVPFLTKHFPDIRIISNSNNPGFAKANNQGTAIAKGQYILYLNPDTLVPEDCFTECLRFLESNPLAGACGLRMIDGSGQYLPESKRGHPTPWASFTKMSGLATLFSTSRFFAGYYLGHLDTRQIQVVDALAGAFMLVPRIIIEQVGGFDERFFMYAEDIDLSYRIRQQQFSNYYLPAPAIIHFKGESTEKDKNYVIQFYRAMDQFVEKHRDNGSSFINSLVKKGIALKTQIEGWKFKGRDSIIAQPSVKSKPARFVLLGDLSAFNSVRKTLHEQELEIIEDASDDNSTQHILCEGPHFPFSSLINWVDEHPGKKYWFHAKGSSSIISSFIKNNRGAVMQLTD